MSVRHINSLSKDSGEYELCQNTIPSEKLKKIQLSWSNLSYSVRIKGKRREVLKGVSGYANPSEILAIMGSSGAGKTSLLSMISNQPHSSLHIRTQGDVKFNGVPIKNFNYPSYARYVMQEDILLPTLTARETIEFSYQLKCGGTSRKMTEKVDSIIEELNLKKCQYNYIGGLLTRGLSGGERKRVSIAVEMIASPSILILDEPTSGLDSVSAKMVINLLKTQASQGKTIILTIHQPSRVIFDMFDRLVLMVSGHFVYSGAANQAKIYFDNLGFVCPERSHCSDFFMRMLYLKDSNSLNTEEQSKVTLMIESYKINKMDEIPEFSEEIQKKASNLQASFFVQFFVLLKRAWINSYRNPFLLGVKVFQAISLGFLVDILYHDLGYGRTQVENRKGVLFYSAMNLVALGSLSNSMTFPLEKPLFLKDYKEGQYGVCAYYFSKIISEVPSQIIPAVIFVLVYYFAVDLNLESADKFFINLGFSVYSHMIGSLIGNLSGVMSPSVVAAVTIGPAVITPFMMYGGYFSNHESYPESFAWIGEISPFSHYFQALCINEFRGLDMDSGLDPLDELNFSGELWTRAVYLMCIQIGTIVLSLLVLKFIGERYKNR
jgi:ABC-type multidrug transport system ATPase subunit/ABC-type multidrug transport system permease subunit